MKSGRALVVVLCIAVVAASSVAFADWPVQRHDPGRSGASPGRADLAVAAVTFRYYLGGGVEKEHLFADDVDGDGEPEIVALTGGRLSAWRTDGLPLWNGAPLGLFRIDAVVDLDGDGVLEIVATGRPAVVAIFDGRDGSLLFRTAPGSLGSEVGAVRVADLDGDDLADLYVADMACGTDDSGGDVAFALAFASGFEPGVDDGSSHRLWQLERGRDEECGQNDVVADLDGDGAPEVVALGGRYAYLFDGRTGRRVSSGSPEGEGGFALGLSIPSGRARTDVADLDGDGQLEVVAYANNAPTETGGLRGIFALDYDPLRPAAEVLRVLWVATVDDPTRDVHVFVHDGAADLDGDGTAEVTTTFRTSERSSILVLDGSTGAVRAHLEDAVVRALHAPESGGAALVVAEVGGQLRGYRLAGGSLEEVLSLPAAAVTSRWDRDRWSRASCATGRVTVPLASGRSGLLLRTGRSVMLFDLTASGAPDAVAMHELPEGTALDSVVGHLRAASGGPGVLVVRTDGTLVVLDEQLRPLSLGPDAGPAELRTGGYYSGDHGLGHVPVAGALGAGADTVVVRSSLGALLHLDARDASLARPPRPLWQWQGMVFPALVDVDDDGQLDVVARTESEVHGRRADGATDLLAVAAVEGGRTLDGDVLPLVDGAGGALLVASSHDVIEGTGQLVALATDGLTWRSSPLPSAGHGHGWLCAAELDGAPGDELAISLEDAISIFDVGSGALLGAGHHGAPSLPIASRGGGSSVDLISVGAAGGISGLAAGRPPEVEAFDVVWSVDEEVSAGGRLGALVDCEDGQVLFVARAAATAALVVDASSGEVRSELYLAGGRGFPSAGALDGSGLVPGSLGNASAVGELAAGAPGVLLGSTDGHLYAVLPCSTPASLLWAIELGAPVGEPVFADTDGDGFEEVLVTAADGYLYGIDSQHLPPPAWVHDLDPASGSSSGDVDETRGAALGAGWAAVEGAARYEWAVLELDGPAITGTAESPFLSAAAREVSFGDGLRPGGRYRVAVRALTEDGRVSPETLSDGTRYLPAEGGPPGDAGPDGGDDDRPPAGCGCTAAGRGESRPRALTPPVDLLEAVLSLWQAP